MPRSDGSTFLALMMDRSLGSSDRLTRGTSPGPLDSACGLSMSRRDCALRASSAITRMESMVPPEIPPRNDSTTRVVSVISPAASSAIFLNSA